MERGNLFQYLKSMSTEHVDHYTLVYDVASGVFHLHREKIVHGDLKGLNILITPDERACIRDLRLSRVAEAYALTLPVLTGNQIKGTTRYLSPELLKSDESSTATQYSNVYAFACVGYEIFTRNVPSHGLNNPMVLVAVLLDKKHP
ncbi:kinase-like protein, partial [Marasmius fiardii PR-910]